ncbi:MAG: hypothetical protein HFK08_05455 [Clostridia bacterium]|nr:hypothetical protein [Clostridia bacterium]
MPKKNMFESAQSTISAANGAAAGEAKRKSGKNAIYGAKIKLYAAAVHVRDANA